MDQITWRGVARRVPCRGVGRRVPCRGVGRWLIIAAAVAALAACQSGRSAVMSPAESGSPQAEPPVSLAAASSVAATGTGTESSPSAPVRSRTSAAPAVAGSPAATRGLPAGRNEGYLTAVDPAHHTITVDPVEWFTGAAAASACQHDGVQPDAEWCNDYYIRNTSRTVVLVSVRADAVVRAYRRPGATEMCTGDDGGAGLCDLTLAELQSVLAENGVPMLAAVTVAGRVATAVEEIYRP